jgi:hypothetical protein
MFFKGNLYEQTFVGKVVLPLHSQVFMNRISINNIIEGERGYGKDREWNMRSV